MQSANLPLPGCEGKASLRCGEATAAASQNPSSKYPNAEKDQSERIGLFLVGEDGFEPSKRNAADLQSVPFGHSGTPPNVQLVVPANFDIIARIWDLSIGFYVILRIIFGKFQAQRRKNRLRYGVGQGRTDSLACGRATAGQTVHRTVCLDRPFESILQIPKRRKRPIRKDWSFSGGGGRIRTIEAKRSRFTVCPLWPLGNSPIFC